MGVWVQQWNTSSTTFKNDIVHTTTSGRLRRRQRISTVSHLWQQRVVVFHPNSWIRLESVSLRTMVSGACMCVEYWCAFFEWLRFLLATAAAAVIFICDVDNRLHSQQDMFYVVQYLRSNMCYCQSSWLKIMPQTCFVNKYQMLVAYHVNDLQLSYLFLVKFLNLSTISSLLELGGFLFVICDPT